MAIESIRQPNTDRAKTYLLVKYYLRDHEQYGEARADDLMVARARRIRANEHTTQRAVNLLYLRAHV